MMKKAVLLSLILLSASATTLLAQNEDNPRRWALSFGIGQTTLDDQSPDGQSFYLSDDLGNEFHIRGDYYLSSRLSLTGGWYLESDGMVTDLSDGIGLKHINMTGPEAGLKFYFCPKKWVVQPHIGAVMQANILNLGTMKGEGLYTAEQGYAGDTFRMNWDVKCPGLSFVPRAGIDIRLISSFSLCLEAGYRVGLWGHNKYDVTFTSGRMTGQTLHHKNSWARPEVAITAKMDFPTRAITRKNWNNLLWLIWSWIGSRQ